MILMVRSLLEVFFLLLITELLVMQIASSVNRQKFICSGHLWLLLPDSSPKPRLLYFKDKMCLDYACGSLFTSDALLLPIPKVRCSAGYSARWFLHILQWWCVYWAIALQLATYHMFGYLTLEECLLNKVISLYSNTFHMAVCCHDKPLTLGFLIWLWEMACGWRMLAASEHGSAPGKRTGWPPVLTLECWGTWEVGSMVQSLLILMILESSNDISVCKSVLLTHSFFTESLRPRGHIQ